MAELLLVKPEEITESTIMGGDVDLDKYTYTIFNTQIMTIEPLLGTLLYDKIKVDYDIRIGEEVSGVTTLTTRHNRDVVCASKSRECDGVVTCGWVCHACDIQGRPNDVPVCVTPHSHLDILRRQ